MCEKGMTYELGRSRIIWDRRQAPPELTTDRLRLPRSCRQTAQERGCPRPLTPCQYAALVEESAAAVASMQDHAAKLLREISVFKLIDDVGAHMAPPALRIAFQPA